MTASTGGTWDGRSSAELAVEWGAPLVESYSTIGSTNDRALELAHAGAPRGTVVVAEEQTAGRGRRGASWQSSAGAGLWMTIVLGVQDLADQLPLVIGVACARAIEAFVPDRRVAIKWPNDLLIDGRKVGGILCERAERGVVAGIGINVSQPATGFDAGIVAAATALDMISSKTLSRRALAGSILDHVLSLLAASDPYRAVMRELEDRDALLGRRIRSEQAGDGMARGFDAGGRLLLERPDGARIAIVSGSVRALDEGSYETPNGRH